MTEREILAALSYAVGQFIECDERPRPVWLWSQMCEAHAAAATHLTAMFGGSSAWVPDGCFQCDEPTRPGFLLCEACKGRECCQMSIYFGFRDWWVGYYRGPDFHYVCLVPTVVIRWPR